MLLGKTGEVGPPASAVVFFTSLYSRYALKRVSCTAMLQGDDDENFSG